MGARGVLSPQPPYSEEERSKDMSMGWGVSLRLREDQAWRTMGHPEIFDETYPASA